MEIGQLALTRLWFSTEFLHSLWKAHGHKPCTADPNKSPKVNNGLYKSQDLRQVKNVLFF